MECRNSTKVGRRFVHRRRATQFPGQSSSVVRHRANRELADVVILDEDVLVANRPSLLQVGIGKGASRIVGGDETGGNRDIELESPEQGITSTGGIQPHAPHADTGGVHSTKERWIAVDKFSPPGWSIGEIACQPPKIIQLVVDSGGEV